MVRARTVQVYMPMSYFVLKRMKLELELDWPTFNGSLITDSLGYPQCIALHLKKDSENLSWSEPFKCNDYSKWDILFCSHESYRSWNCSSIYDVYILEHEDKPYGIPCEAKHSVANSSDNCSMPDARCCRQWSETTKESCETYIPGTSIDLAKVNCGIGTRQVDISGRYYCRCPYGSTGPLCQIKVKCPLFPCLNGECRNESCECTSGYTGILCEKPNPSCKNVNCGQDNDCVLVRNLPRCYCHWSPRVYELSEECLIVSNTCLSNPCEHGSTCIAKNRGYTCICTGGFTGKHCSTEYKSCHEDPCRNGGSCHTKDNGYSCSCNYPFSGKTCEIDMRHCHQFFLCQNGGHCVPSQLGYYCVCSDGYTGPSCEEKVDMCDGPNPCMNDGVCYRTAVGSRCACLLEYGGKLCDYEDLQKQRYINEILTSRVQGRTWKVVVAALTLVASCAFIYWVSRKMEAAACSEWNDSSKSSQPDVKISKPQRRKSIFSGISLETVASFVARCFRRSITDDSSTSATTKSRITGRSFFRRFAWLFGRKR
uniref:EGF-like domain-containing protein n=1 Tax=Trichuris muris TaxID=70415 RepID=A0A5S6QDZ3_TRIMR